MLSKGHPPCDAMHLPNTWPIFFFLTFQGIRNNKCGSSRTTAIKETLSELRFMGIGFEYHSGALSGTSFSWFSSNSSEKKRRFLPIIFAVHQSSCRSTLCSLCQWHLWRKWIENVKISRTRRWRHLWWYEKLSRRVYFRYFCVPLSFRLIIQGVLFIVFLSTATATECPGGCKLFSRDVSCSAKR
jgi:hypothetical protein